MKMMTPNPAKTTTFTSVEKKQLAAGTRFLRGPQSRFRELIMAFRAFREMISGFRKLHFVGPCVTVFGVSPFSGRSSLL